MNHLYKMLILLALTIIACGDSSGTDTDAMPSSSGGAGGKSDEVLEPDVLCEQTSGTWIDAPSDGLCEIGVDCFVCECAPDEIFFDDVGCMGEPDVEEVCDTADGSCPSLEDLCGDFGGEFQSGPGWEYCDCGTFVAEDGICALGDPNAAAACGTTGGNWTDDASDAFVCDCPADKVDATLNGCLLPTEFEMVCTASGGTFDASDVVPSCECPGGRIADSGDCEEIDSVDFHGCTVSGGDWLHISAKTGTDVDATFFPEDFFCECPDGTEATGRHCD